MKYSQALAQVQYANDDVSPIVQVGLWTVAGKVIDMGVEEADD